MLLSVTRNPFSAMRSSILAVSLQRPDVPQPTQPQVQTSAFLARKHKHHKHHAKHHKHVRAHKKHVRAARG